MIVVSKLFYNYPPSPTNPPREEEDDEAAMKEVIGFFYVLYTMRS